MLEFQMRLDGMLNRLIDAGEKHLAISLSPRDRDTLHEETPDLEITLTLLGMTYAYRGWRVFVVTGDPSHVAYAQVGKTRYSKAYL